MAIYRVTFKLTDIGNGWMSSVARQTENPKNKSQVAIGESEIMTKEKARSKVMKAVEHIDFTLDEIIFEGRRIQSVEDLSAAMSRVQ